MYGQLIGLANIGINHTRTHTHMHDTHTDAGVTSSINALEMGLFVLSLLFCFHSTNSVPFIRLDVLNSART